MKNIEIREFKLNLENYINNNSLPLEVKRMVLKEIYEDIEQKSNLAMMEEIKERDTMEVKKSAESPCEH